MLLSKFIGHDRTKFAEVMKTLRRPEKYSTREEVLAMAPTWLIASPEVSKVLGIEQRPEWPFGIQYNGTWKGIEVYYDSLFPQEGLVLGGTMMGPMDGMRRLKVALRAPDAANVA